jgi:hypothetical protein
MAITFWLSVHFIVKKLEPKLDKNTRDLKNKDEQIANLKTKNINNKREYTDEEKKEYAKNKKNIE